ncbi:MAG: sigma-70 family RNA polymerase sigma factor [Planctomycetes bacterium]|nr:sigma-70 family RNA polymerase sigma factor [Planctomycetota bacterium]
MAGDASQILRLHAPFAVETGAADGLREVRDEALMACFRDAAAEAAFSELVRRHTPRAWRVACALLGRAEAADDAVQESFLRLLRARGQYRDGEPFLPWLLAIVRNACRDELKRPRLDRARAAANAPQAAGDPHAQVQQQEDFRRACAALAQLPAPEREALTLRVHGGLDFAAIAAACGITTDAAKKRVYRGLDALRQTLA